MFLDTAMAYIENVVNTYRMQTDEDLTISDVKLLISAFADCIEEVEYLEGDDGEGLEPSSKYTGLKVGDKVQMTLVSSNRKEAGV